jgi:hypothetical protein
LAGAAGALLLQGGFVFLFLYSMPNFRPPRDLGRELILILRPMPRPVLRPAAPAARIAPVAPVIQNTPGTVVPFAPAAPPPAVPGISNFGQALNGCALEKYNSLTPEQRARCPRPGAGVAIQELPNLMGTPSHVKDEAHWEEEWAHEKAPEHNPCMAQVLCYLAMIATGHGGELIDPRKWPHYEIDQLPPEDFYKVEQAYNAWHKEHPVEAPQ